MSTFTTDRNYGVLSVIRLVFCLGTLVFGASIYAQSAVSQVLLDDDTGRYRHADTRVGQEYYVDKDGLFSVNQAVTLFADTAKARAPRSTVLNKGEYLWAKTEFKNTGNRERADFLIFYCCGTEASVHVIKDGQLARTYAGEELLSLPDEPVAIPMNTRPGEKVTVIYRGRLVESLYITRAGGVTVHDSSAYLTSAIWRYGNGYFMLGYLMCLLIFSAVVYLLYRERGAIFLGLVLFGFGAYFHYYGQITGLLPSYDTLRFYGMHGANLANCIIMVGMTGFLYYYLDLPTRHAKLLPWYGGVTAVALVVGIAWVFNQLESEFFFYLANLTTTAWVLFSATIVALAAWRGGRSEKVLLASTVLLVVGTLVLITSVLLGWNVPWFTRLFQYSFLVFTSLLFYGVYDKVSSVTNEAKQLKDQFTFRSRFFANITHEFRTPLTLILGPIRQLLDRTSKAADKELLEIAHRNAQRQLRLVNQILDLSTTNKATPKMQEGTVDVVSLLQRLTMSYASLADQHEIDLTFETSLEKLPITADREKLETIVYNLLTNAFKFTMNGGRIGVGLNREGEDIVLTVRDTGVGIPEKALPQVFERYYSDQRLSREGTYGNGIGLALTKELVLLHGGQISVISQPELETIFTVRLPYRAATLSHFPAPAAAPSSDGYRDLRARDRSSGTDDSQDESTPKLPLVLVVEDNADMRTYLKIGLGGSYRIAEAEDGRRGIELAQKMLPDLIVSDVMMPEMDGFELCADLKTSLATSHIPIILLTARSAAKDRIQGLDLGADDYLTKPFEVPELRARVRNLINSRKLLRERFAESLTLKPEEVTATSVDQEFLRAAVQAVEDSMDDESFGIDELALQLNVSRPGLNRKFRALLDQSSNQFIQSIRLERAADLLLKTQDTVAMISDAVGFRSASYFIKSFREKFDCTPGQYRKG